MLFFPYFRYYEDFEKRIPRQEIEEIESKVRDVIESVDKKYLLTICGSYRFVLT